MRFHQAELGATNFHQAELGATGKKPIFAGINELLFLKNRKFYQTIRFSILYIQYSISR